MLLQLVSLDAVSHSILQRRLLSSVLSAVEKSGEHDTDYDISRYFGRRPVYVWGMAAMAIELCIIGILNPWTNKTSVGWAQAIMTLVWTFTFQLSAGQLGMLSSMMRLDKR